jgi:hypothetical protein
MFIRFLTLWLGVFLLFSCHWWVPIAPSDCLCGVQSFEN